MKLSELAHDALVEIFNHGVGQAARAFSEIAGEAVTLRVPSIDFMLRGELLGSVGAHAPGGVCGVHQVFRGAVTTQAALMFPVEQSLELVRMMVGGEVPLDELAAMEGEALAEIGNIILNSVVASLADLLQIEFEGSLPTVELGTSASQVIIDADPHQRLLVLQIDFELARRELHGFVAFLLDLDSSEVLSQKLDGFLDRLPA